MSVLVQNHRQYVPVSRDFSGDMERPVQMPARKAPGIIPKTITVRQPSADSEGTSSPVPEGGLCDMSCTLDC